MTKMKKVVNRKFRPQKSRFQIEPATLVLVRQIVVGVSLFSLVGLVLVGIWHGTRVSALTISEVSVSDGPTIKGSLIRKTVEEVLEGDYIRLVPRRFSLFYPEKEILDRLEGIERIKDVKLDKISRTALHVTFSEYKPYALWCGNEIELCYFLDEKGFAFGVAPTLTGESLVRYYRSDKEPQLQTSYSDIEDFEKTKKFTEMMAQGEWYIVRVEIDSVRDVFYTLADDSELRLTLRDEVEEPFHYLEALLGSNEFLHLKPGNFQYVDLRFGSKIYVNEERIEILTDDNQNNLLTGESAATQREVITEFLPDENSYNLINTGDEVSVVEEEVESEDVEDEEVGFDEEG